MQSNLNLACKTSGRILEWTCKWIEQQGGAFDTFSLGTVAKSSFTAAPFDGGGCDSSFCRAILGV